MGRRDILGSLCVLAASGGIAAMIGATALPSGSPYALPLAVVGAGGVLLGLAGMLVLFINPEARKRQRIRERLGELLAEGAAIQRQAEDESGPEPTDEQAQAWLNRVTAYIMAELDRSYVDRMRDGSCVPVGVTTLTGTRQRIQNGVRSKNWHLQQFIRELQ